MGWKTLPKKFAELEPKAAKLTHNVPVYKADHLPHEKLWSEHDHQVAFVQWVKHTYGDSREGDIFAVPNGAKLPYIKTAKGTRHAPQALRLLAEGMQPGVADLLLLLPRGEYHGLCIEMKKVGGKPRQEQIAWLQKRRTDGYCVGICEGWKSAMVLYLDFMQK